MNKKILIKNLIKIQSLDNLDIAFKILVNSPEFSSYFLFEEENSDYIEYLQYLVSKKTPNLYTNNCYDKYWFLDISKLCGFYNEGFLTWEHTYIKNLKIKGSDIWARWGNIDIYLNSNAIINLINIHNEDSIKRIETEVEFLDEILKFIKNG